MNPPFELDVLQRWMMSVISHPSGIEAGITSEQARNEIKIVPAELESIITRSQACTSHERLAVYSNAYFARLLECLQSEFPGLLAAAGEEAFGAFAFGYLVDYPSSSYTLNQLGRHFPQYLVDTRPPREKDEESPDWADFLINVAQLERIYAEVFDGPGEEKISLLNLDDLKAIPSELWGDVRLQTSDSLRLARFSFPVHEFITAARRDLSPEMPEVTPTWLVVNRRDYIVRRQPVSEVQWRLLQALRAGSTLGEAIKIAVHEAQQSVDQLALDLGQWFRNWTAAGYFRSIQIAPDLA